LLLGGRYRHIEGTEYTVDKIILDATGWEEIGKLEEKVLYTQQVVGHFPIGTQYSRSVDDFLEETTHEGKA